MTQHFKIIIDDPIIRDEFGNVIQGRDSFGNISTLSPADPRSSGFIDPANRGDDPAFDTSSGAGTGTGFDLLVSGETPPSNNAPDPSSPDNPLTGSVRFVPPGGEVTPPPSTQLRPGPGLPGGPGGVDQRPVFTAPLQPGPGTGFSVDPRDSEKVLASLAQFVNAMFNSQLPGLQSGVFTNPNQVAGNLQSQFTNTIDPSNFQNFLNQLQGFGSGNPLGDQLSQQLLGQLGGGGDQQQQALIAQLFGQPAVQSLSTGRASDLFQQLGTQGGGTGSPLQGFLDQQLRSQIEGGGISPEFVTAARERILDPANEALSGRLNAQGGGVASPDSPLFQELQRRQEADFANDLILLGGGQQQAALGQAGQLGQQQFGNLFGIGQAQGQLGQTQQQINQQAFGIGGQLQNQLATQGLQATQLGLGREEFAGGFQQQNTSQALQFLQLMNLFGLGQTDIASSLTRQLLGGAQIANPKGSFLNALVGGGATVASAFAGGGGQ